MNVLSAIIARLAPAIACLRRGVRSDRSVSVAQSESLDHPPVDGCPSQSSSGTGGSIGGNDPDDQTSATTSASRQTWFDEYVARIDATPAELPLRCPCCGYKTLSERGVDDICRVCFWQDDGQDDYDADVRRGGPNRLSLSEARTNYRAFAASEERFVEKVRPPLASEMLD